MTTLRRQRGLTALASAAGLLGGLACSLWGRADFVTLHLPPCIPLAVGDSTFAAAVSHQNGGGWTTVAWSDGMPERFAWVSRDERVLTVTPRGLMRARAPGDSWLVVTTDHVRDSTRVTVTPTSAVRVDFRPAPPYVVALGDTLRVEVGVVGFMPPPDSPTGGTEFLPLLSVSTVRVVAVNEVDGPPDAPMAWHVVGQSVGRDVISWSAGGRCGMLAVDVVAHAPPCAGRPSRDEVAVSSSVAERGVAAGRYARQLQRTPRLPCMRPSAHPYGAQRHVSVR